MISSSAYGKVLGIFFFEPSTRTRLSFETAMKRLGGEVIGIENAKNSSLVKGESIQDTIITISKFVDAMVIRHSEPCFGFPNILKSEINCPIISGGDGSDEHPTQALLDVYTIKKNLGRVDGLKILISGDLTYGRTVHSLIQVLKLYDVELYCYSSLNLQITAGWLRGWAEEKVHQINDITEILPEIDVLYMTRSQNERHNKKIKHNFVVDSDVMEKMKEYSLLMHPLPRNEEIDPIVDNDTRSVYFEQVKNGVYVRMALLYDIFDLDVGI